MPIFNESVTQWISFAQTAVGETILTLDAYGSLEQANQYFSNRLRSEVWKRAELDDQKSSLVEATRIIDALNFAGDKHDALQIHEFPRGTDLLVPKAIEFACYEIAIKLLDDIDPDREIDNLAADHRVYAGVRTTYDRKFALDHIRAGVPSATAWRYLLPYLCDPLVIKLGRV